MPRIALFIIWIFHSLRQPGVPPRLDMALAGTDIPAVHDYHLFPGIRQGVGVTGSAWVWVGFGVLLDLLWHGASASKRARRRAYD